jgi:hypothetical protein
MKKLLLIALFIIIPISASAYWKTLSTSKGDVTYWVPANPDSIEARLITLEQEVESMKAIILKLTEDAKQDSTWGMVIKNPNIPPKMLHSPVGRVPAVISWEDSVYFWHLNRLRGIK